VGGSAAPADVFRPSRSDRASLAQVHRAAERRPSRSGPIRAYGTWPRTWTASASCCVSWRR
jgi:hypothetical protein